jgi:DNA-binding Xre family transcriptional regulator
VAIDYEWRLRLLMAERGMFKPGELGPRLAEHGVRLSDSQVWRLVTGKPERLNLRTLVALCRILDCEPNDLIRPVEAPTAHPRGREQETRRLDKDLEPKPVRLRRPDR